MWIYDGEEWIEEGVSNSDKQRTDVSQPRREEFYPELQVIEVEIVPVPRTNYVPPFPLP